MSPDVAEDRRSGLARRMEARWAGWAERHRADGDVELAAQCAANASFWRAADGPAEEVP